MNDTTAPSIPNSPGQPEGPGKPGKPGQPGKPGEPGLAASRCHVCGHPAPAELAAFPALARVTSDCRPFRPGGRLGLCPACGALQKIVDAAFDADCAEIYARYRLYHQGQGAEQRIFDQRTGASRPRSALIIDHLASLWPAPDSPDSPDSTGMAGTAGRLLDIGCGEGFFLEAFGRRFPAWTLAGLDMGERYRSRIESLPGVTAYYQGDPAQARGPWDVITLNHTLEHIPRPADHLASLRGLLAPGGLLLLNVPDWTANPFDLVIADHCTHFTAPLLARVFRAAGLSPLSLTRGLIPKEWLAVARAEPGAPAELGELGEWGELGEPGELARMADVLAALDWLERFAAQARQARDEAPAAFGVFGTAIAGVWLDAALPGGADFFVDEAPDRAGGDFMGRPVFTPRQVPAGATVFLAFPPEVAARIAARLARTPGQPGAHVAPRP